MKKIKTLVTIICFCLISVSVFAGSTSNFGWPTPIFGNTDWFSVIESFFLGVDNQVNANKTNITNNTSNISSNTANITGNTTTLSETTAPGNFSSGVVLGTASILNLDGSHNTNITVTWIALADTDISYYEVRVKKTTDTVYTYYQTSKTETQIILTDIVGGTSYSVNIRGIDRNGNVGNWSPDSAIVGATDGTAPTNPAGFTVVGAFDFFVLKWTNPSDLDFDHTEVWRSSTNDRSLATKITTTRSDWYHDGTFDPNITKYYWIRAVDSTGTASSYFPVSSTAGITGTTVFLDVANKIADATIDIATKVSGLLPNANLANITDPLKLSGQIVKSSNIQPGTINSAAMVVGRIIAADNIVAGTITANEIFGNTITANELQTGSVTADEVSTNAIIASSLNVVNGAISSADIASLDAGKITTGTLTVDSVGGIGITVNNGGSILYKVGGKLKFNTASGFFNTILDSNASDTRLYPSGAVGGSSLLLGLGTVNDSFETINMTSFGAMSIKNIGVNPKGNISIDSGNQLSLISNNTMILTAPLVSVSNSLTVPTIAGSGGLLTLSDKTTVQGTLTVSGTTSVLKLPKYANQAAAPVCDSTREGALVWGTNLKQIIFCNGTAWSSANMVQVVWP